MDDTDRHANTEKGTLMGPQYQAKDYRQLKNMERNIFPREEHTSGFPMPSAQPCNHVHDKQYYVE